MCRWDYTVRLTIHLFAALRDAVGRPQVDLNVSPPCEVSELREALAREYPALAAMLPHVLVALNHEYARNEDVIPEGAEIALIPPVSGGGLSSGFEKQPLSE